MADSFNKFKKFLQTKSLKEKMVVLVLCGLLLMIAFRPAVKNTTGETDLFKTGEESVADVPKEAENRLENILEMIEGIGNVEVMITETEEKGLYHESSGKIEGVVVVCECADNSEKVLLIHDVIEALFSVDSHKIRIVKGSTSHINEVEEAKGEKK